VRAELHPRWILRLSLDAEYGDDYPIRKAFTQQLAIAENLTESESKLLLFVAARRAFDLDNVEALV